MKHYISAIALCIGSTFLATGCGSSGSSSSSTPSCTTGQVLYSAGNTCVQSCGLNNGTQGYVNGVCTTVAGVGTTGYGSCSTCVTPNGQSGVLLNFYGTPTCGLPLVTSYGYGGGSGTINGQIYGCYNGGGLGYGVPTTGYGGTTYYPPGYTYGYTSPYYGYGYYKGQGRH